MPQQRKEHVLASTTGLFVTIPPFRTQVDLSSSLKQTPSSSRGDQFSTFVGRTALERKGGTTDYNDHRRRRHRRTSGTLHMVGKEYDDIDDGGGGRGPSLKKHKEKIKKQKEKQKHSRNGGRNNNNGSDVSREGQQQKQQQHQRLSKNDLNDMVRGMLYTVYGNNIVCVFLIPY